MKKKAAGKIREYWAMMMHKKNHGTTRRLSSCTF